MAWKNSNCAWNNGDLGGILSGTCPLSLQMAWIDFNSWFRHLSGIFSQMIILKKTWARLGQVGIMRLVWDTFNCSDILRFV